jgi:ribulose-phosphate 3-epimerase
MPDDYLLAPSILSADFLRLGQAIQEVEAAGADWIHIDVMDGHFVPNISMGPIVVAAARRATGLPLDVHLMITDPDRYLAAFSEAGADSLTVHVEAVDQLHRTLKQIHELGLRAGVAMNPATSAGQVYEALPLLDLVLVMTVEPGFAGQSFIPETLRKVEQLREWQNAGITRALIEVDGGITAETAPLAARAGAEVFVAASAIFEHAGGAGAGVQAILESLERKPIQE